MAIGNVRFFNTGKGYGFIEIEGQPDVFVHVRSLRQSKFTGSPVDGEKLSFDIEDSEKGPRASNIVRVA